MKTINSKLISILALLVCVHAHADGFNTTSSAAEDINTANESKFSIRVKPVALMFGIFGGEVYFENKYGYFLGLGGQYFTETNTDKVTSLTNAEYGVRFGKFFGKDSGRAYGFYIQGALELYQSTVTSFYSATQQNLRGDFYQLGALLYVGYQFRATFIDPRRFNVRLGLGMGYKPSSTVRIQALDGTRVPVGVLERLDPALDFTLGYLL